MPSFAELKAKAAGATNSGVEKFQNVRDRNTSVPMKNTNWDPYSGKPPPPLPPPKANSRTRPTQVAPLPPPPRRTSSTAEATSTPTLPSRGPLAPPAPALPKRVPSAPTLPTRGPSAAPPPPPPRASPSVSFTKAPSPPGPPPIIRNTRPGFASRQLTPSYTRHEEPEEEYEEPAEEVAHEEENIDWANLSLEDKQVFFSWLDEFFAKFLNISIPPRSAHGTIEHHASPGRVSSKSASPNRPATTATISTFTLSHPPPSSYDSSALDLVHYFSPSTPWPNSWYASATHNAIPPPLEGNTDITWNGAWQSYGINTTIYMGILFSDLSIFWGTIEYDSSQPSNKSKVKRDAAYLPRPRPLDQAALVEASETYGDTIASFAESFLGTGEYCARGECWDLANEALKYFADFDYVPKPVPSISRTHGHLIYEGKAGSKGAAEIGRWRGGDDRIRRGDIVEWRRVKIEGLRGSYFKLGDPDHTAVIVSDLVLKGAGTLQDGKSLKPSELGALAVVEQSVGQPPERKEYDLKGFREGEMWIYRPVGMEAYLGISAVEAKAPDGFPTLLKL
ncbi:hypothetical protein BDQ12DRAFT_724023 [Crucibulum laeve]|uniref:BBC1/AIM3 cysteine proteinase-fold domain-containing protein n=1 Tax=Crucibulum laeve TaxID=68775 RepID=A0A5C3LWH0_9AGAR|nr:hypothetical protein BDQ12DRAFT_724023 [Crucibulum laeve]